MRRTAVAEVAVVLAPVAASAGPDKFPAPQLHITSTAPAKYRCEHLPLIRASAIDTVVFGSHCGRSYHPGIAGRVSMMMTAFGSSFERPIGSKYSSMKSESSATTQVFSRTW